MEDELIKLEQFTNSANVLKTLYRSEFETLKERRQAAQSQETSFGVNSELSTESDNLIRDSLVIRYM